MSDIKNKNSSNIIIEEKGMIATASKAPKDPPPSETASKNPSKK